MAKLDPFRLQPILVERPWGGSRLAEYGKELPQRGLIGESWELCDLPRAVARHVDDPSSPVLDGAFAGERLRTVVAAAGTDLLGPVPPTPDGRFPLLFKLLDAHQNLSIQVHPHEAYVASHPETRLKTESWYVVDADAGTSLYLDVVDGISMQDVEAAMGGPEIVPLLGAGEAVPGAFHHVPAGLIHALGAGALIAEVQTPSDTTFRLYDWAQEYARAPRQLHAAESLASIRIQPEDAFSLAPVDALGVRELVRTDHYWMREHRIGSGVSPLAQRPGPVVLSVTRGRAVVGELELTTGTTAIVPASARISVVEGATATVLEMGF